MKVIEGQPNCSICGASVKAGTTVCGNCATKSAPIPSPFPVIPGYQILSRLGAGGMGTVYLAEETELRRKVAIKFISERLPHAGDATARFLREARTMATVEHPHIVHVYALGHVGEAAYLVMEYVEGETLADCISRTGRLSVAEALESLRQVVDALDASWEKKIVHRDIKPSNILLDKRSQIHVTDFGIAKPIHLEKQETLTGEGSILGTPHYFSPEQALARAIDFRSDIYSLGIVFFEMLTGEKPFNGHTPFEIVSQHLTTPLPSVRTIRPEIPQEVAKLLEWMTEKNPDRRPSSYKALRQAIDSYLAGRTTDPASAISTLIVARGRIATKIKIATVLIAMLAVAWLVGTRFKIEKTQAPEISVQTHPSVAVAPFYGPDEDSSKEGRLMAGLIEQSIRNKLGNEIKVIGIDQTQSALKSHESARTLGERFGATIVLWGEVFTVRDQSEIQPHFTLVPQKLTTEIQWEPHVWDDDPFAALLERSAGSVVLESEVPNQIELRKTSAAGIGEMVSLFAGIHALYQEEDAQKALSLFEQIKPSAESFYYRARALLKMDQREQAMAALQESLRLDPKYAPGNALRGDLMMASGSFPEALSAYQFASDAKQEFTTSRAIFYHGELYIKEIFRSEKYTEGKEQDTAWIVGVDPNSGKVLERHHLPGIPKAFNMQKGSIHILMDTGFGGESTLVFRDGKFDRTLFGEQDLLLRIQSMQSGWATAANFMEDWENVESIGQAKFAAGKILHEDAPGTLPELETALRTALERDSTQHWHLFFLGEAIWWQGRKAEAEEVWRKITAARFPYVPYYELAWMASLFEAFGQNAWADHAYNQALQRREQLPLPVEFSTFRERLINANFIRTAAYASRQGMSPQRAHVWLSRARELTGLCPEGDDFAAAAWQRYFEDANDSNQAKRESEYFKKAQGHPLNTVRATTFYDYSFYFLIATTVSFLLVCLLLLAKASRIHLDFELKERHSLLRSRVVCLTIYTLMSLIGLWIGVEVVRTENYEIFIIGVSFLLFLFLMLRSKKVGVRALVASISPQQRGVFASAFLLLMISLIIAVYFNRSVQALLSRPIETSDSAENLVLLQFMEERLKEIDIRATRYSAAVLNHMSGNKERAQDLYQSLEDDPLAQKNLAALQNNEWIPPHRLSAEDLYHAYVALPWRSWISRIWNSGNGLNIFYSDSVFGTDSESQQDLVSFFFQIIIFLSIAVFLSFSLIAPAKCSEITSSGRFVSRWVSKTIFTTLPGSFEMVRGNAFRGYIILTLFLLVLFAALIQILFPHHRFPVPGIATFLLMPNYLNTIPFPMPAQPSGTDAIVSHHFWTIFWAYPYGKLFWGFVVSAAVFSLTLHTLSLRMIWRS